MVPLSDWRDVRGSNCAGLEESNKVLYFFINLEAHDNKYWIIYIVPKCVS